MKNIKQKYNRVVKYFDYLIKKTLFQHKNKTNNLFVYNHKFKISNFNKYLIAVISLIFIYLFYLSIPNLYNKTWVQNTIEKKLTNEFQLNFSVSSEIKYEILPSPHFTIRNVKIYNNEAGNVKNLSEIKILKVFISQKNFFKKKELEIKDILIKKANFSIQKNDFNFLKIFFNNKFSKKKIIVKDSNIFFNGDDDEIISITKISNLSLFYDELNFFNKFSLKGQAFNIPFNIEFNKNILSSSNESKLKVNLKKLKINLDNSSTKVKKNISGLNVLSILNSKLVSIYTFKENSLIFKSKKSKVNNVNVDYSGKLSIDPFDLILDIDINELNLKNLLNANLVFLELFKTSLLFNDRISLKVSINTDKIVEKLFNSGKIVLNIFNGNIDLNQSILLNEKIGKLKVLDSKFYMQDNNLVLSSNLNISLKDSDKFFSYLQTPRKKRKLIKDIFIGVDYDFFNDQVILTSFKINNKKQNKKNSEIIRNFNNSNNVNISNQIAVKNLMNRLIID